MHDLGGWQRCSGLPADPVVIAGSARIRIASRQGAKSAKERPTRDALDRAGEAALGRRRAEAKTPAHDATRNDSRSLFRSVPFSAAQTLFVMRVSTYADATAEESSLS